MEATVVATVQAVLTAAVATAAAAPSRRTSMADDNLGVSVVPPQPLPPSPSPLPSLPSPP